MSETRAVTLETSVDTTGARAGFQEIQREAGTMAQAVARASEHADTAVEGIGTSAASSARNVDASTRNMINAIQRQTAAMEAGSRSGSAYYEVLARQRGVDPVALEPYLAQLRAIEQQQARTNNAVGGAARPLHQVEMSAAQTAAALRMVPAQFTDIVTGLQGGQSPMTILFQQGGQLRDMFGSTGAAARALGGYVLGLINPFTVATAVAIGLAVAYKNGRDEINAFNMAIITSGNVAGTTSDQLADMAANVAKLSGTRGAAAAALNGLVQTGQVQAQNLQAFAQAVIDAERIMGRSVEQTTADFEKLGKAPLQGLAEINAKYHNVTAATYAQVKALQDQGRYAEAANVAQQAYADGIVKQKQAVLDSLSDWERGWLRIKNGVSGVVDEVLNLREATAQEKIGKLLDERDKIEENMRRARARGLTADVAMYQAELDANERLINSIRGRGKAEKDAATAQAQQKRGDAIRQQITDAEDILKTPQQRLKDMLAAAEKNDRANGLNDAEVAKHRAIIIRQNYDVITEGIERQIDAVGRLGSLDEIRTQRQLSQIGAARATGTITDEDAIQRSAKIELDALDRQRERLQQTLDITKKRVNSERDQDAIRGQMAEANEHRLSREAQLTSDLLALDRLRFQASVQLVSTSFDKAMGDRNDLRAQVRDQRDYNEQIGMTGEELLNLSIRRREEQAARKDTEAEIAEGKDLYGEEARLIREQAAALRDLSVAEREGFIKARDPYVNIRMSLNRYVEESENAGGMVGDALTSAFRRAEDAFADFVTNGKLSFSSLATSIIADFARIHAKAVIGGFAKSILGSMSTDTTSGWGASLMQALGVSGARAAGGPVNSGLSYLVGEKGPEIFTPSTSGSITPNNMIGSGGGSPITIQTNVNVTSGGTTSSTAGDQAGAGRALADMVSMKAKEVIVRESRQGGILWNMKMGRT